MRVIKDNSNKSNFDKTKLKAIHIVCDKCNSELKITEEDTHIGWLGAAFVTCPCCEQETMVDELKGIELTVDNIDFPIHFNRTNKNGRGVTEISNEEIIGYIKQGINWFRKYKSEYVWYVSVGDLLLTIFKYSDDEEYWITVTKDFYETYIPFEEIDYD